MITSSTEISKTDPDCDKYEHYNCGAAQAIDIDLETYLSAVHNPIIDDEKPWLKLTFDTIHCIKA